MAAREKLTIIVDMVADKATASVKKLDRQLEAAGKTTDGLKGSMNRAGQWLSNNWQGITVAAGTAAVGFAAKSVKAFEETALAAGKMADATGLAVDDASRWREVADDLGVNADSIATGLNKMNREAAKGGLAAVGIDAKGTNDQFLAVLRYLNKIPDAATRAKEGTRLLGKGWQELAPLVTKVGELRDRLAEVSDAKVIDDEERRKAERLRDALDALKDVSEDLQLTAGEELTPAVEGLTLAIEDLSTVAEDDLPLPDFFQKGSLELYRDIRTELEANADNLASRFIPGLSAAKRGTDEFDDSLGPAAQALEATSRLTAGAALGMGAMADKAGDAASGADDLADSADDAARATDRLYDATLRLADEQVDLSDAEVRFTDTLAALAEARGKATDKDYTAAEKAKDVADAERDARDAAIQLAKAHADQAAATAEANGQTFTAQQRADLMRQSLQYVAAQLQGPTRDALLRYIDTLGKIPPTVATRVTTSFTTSGDQRGRPGQAFAAGGTPDRGVAWVGEHGPEPVVFPGRGERVVSTSEARQTLREAATGGGGGEPIVVKLVLDGREIAEALVRRERGMR